ncbi:MAG: hypothetical protein LBK53_00575 [Heliobacteriaceae bacterium]|nr:hypothetical protein [Heliobacteriaceae bacterium]
MVKEDMFNSVNNPFNQKIASSTSSDKNKQQKEQEQKEKKKRLIDGEEPDEVRLGGQPILTEDEIAYMVKSYIAKLKEEHAEREKVVQKLDKYLANFDLEKFMKRNPNMTSPDFYMVMFNETESLIK